MTSRATRPVVVCPLEFERRRLRRAAVDRDFDLVVCGPGTHGVVVWAETASCPTGTVILAGLAGALGPALSPGGAAMIGRVVDEQHDHTWEPTIPSGSGRTITVTSVAGPVVRVEERRTLAARTGADLVDQESVAFARMATMRGWRWAIVRGVSDGPDDTLPASIGAWVDGHGRVRIGRVASALLARPRDVGVISRLRSNSARAMDQVASLLLQLARDDAADPSTLRTDIGRM